MLTSYSLFRSGLSTLTSTLVNAPKVIATTKKPNIIQTKLITIGNPTCLEYTINIAVAILTNKPIHGPVVFVHGTNNARKMKRSQQINQLKTALHKVPFNKKIQHTQDLRSCRP